MVLGLFGGEPVLSQDEDEGPYLPIVIPPSQPGVLTDTRLYGDGRQPEVVFLYWYGCPACAALDTGLIPLLVNSLPKGTLIYRVPYVSDLTVPLWQAHGRMALTLNQMGIEKFLHLDIIRTILPFTMHGEYDSSGAGVPLATLEQQADFVAAHGYSREKYLEAYNSPELLAELNRVKEFQEAKKAQVAPIALIEGRFYYNFSSNIALLAARISELVKIMASRPAPPQASPPQAPPSPPQAPPQAPPAPERQPDLPQPPSDRYRGLTVTSGQPWDR
jgi:hypothetical protein